MATLALIRSRVSAKLKLDNTAASGDQTLVDSWANEAIVDILAKTHCTVRWSTLNLTSGQAINKMPTQPLAILDITTAGPAYTGSLRRLPLDELNQRRIQSNSPPARYYSLEGFDLLILYPTPGTGEVLTIFYVPTPTTYDTASKDTVFTEVPVQWHKSIEWYCLREGADMDDNQNKKMGMMAEAQYQRSLVDIKKAMRRQGGSVLPIAIPHRETAMPTGSDPSVYP